MGDPNGTPVVLIHGYTDNARDWVPLIPYLSKHFHLIVVDLRGHGRSSKPDCCYTLPDFAYDIVLLLDTLGVRQADIVGHSLGSMIAQVFAEDWPEHTGQGGVDFIQWRPATRCPTERRQNSTSRPRSANSKSRWTPTRRSWFRGGIRQHR